MNQLSLFSDTVLSVPISYYPDFLSTKEADELYRYCLQLQWQQNRIRMLDKSIPVPRLECMYGDESCDYLYSNTVLLKPLPWTEQLAELRERITKLTGYKFNIVVGNQYRTGAKSH